MTIYTSTSHLKLNKNAKTFEEYCTEITIAQIGSDYTINGYISPWNGCKTKLSMVCPIHGEWCSGSIDHLRRHVGCPKCGTELRTSKQLKTQQDTFEERSKLVHGNIYDYSKFIYSHNAAKSIIICKFHGEFYQTPNIHLTGHGCPLCGIKTVVDIKLSRGLSKLIKLSKTIHNDKYDYTKFIYKDYHIPSTIICPIHNEFLQSPAAHLSGSGCPSCANYGYNPEKDGYIYLIKIRNENGHEFLGYGKTRTFKIRLSQHQTQIHKHGYYIIEEPFVVFVGNGKNATKIETIIKNTFPSSNIKINGFKTENTNIDFYEDIKNLIVSNILVV